MLISIFMKKLQHLQKYPNIFVSERKNRVPQQNILNFFIYWVYASLGIIYHICHLKLYQQNYAKKTFWKLKHHKYQVKKYDVCFYSKCTYFRVRKNVWRKINDTLLENVELCYGMHFVYIHYSVMITFYECEHFLRKSCGIMRTYYSALKALSICWLWINSWALMKYIFSC